MGYCSQKVYKHKGGPGRLFPKVGKGQPGVHRRAVPGGKLRIAGNGGRQAGVT